MGCSGHGTAVGDPVGLMLLSPPATQEALLVQQLSFFAPSDALYTLIIAQSDQGRDAGAKTCTHAHTGPGCLSPATCCHQDVFRRSRCAPGAPRARLVRARGRRGGRGERWRGGCAAGGRRGCGGALYLHGRLRSRLACRRGLLRSRHPPTTGHGGRGRVRRALFPPAAAAGQAPCTAAGHPRPCASRGCAGGRAARPAGCGRRWWRGRRAI